MWINVNGALRGLVISKFVENLKRISMSSVSWCSQESYSSLLKLWSVDTPGPWTPIALTCATLLSSFLRRFTCDCHSSILIKIHHRLLPGWTFLYGWLSEYVHFARGGRVELDGIAGESEAGKSECFVEHCFWFVFNFNRTQRGLLLNQNDLTLKIWSAKVNLRL